MSLTKGTTPSKPNVTKPVAPAKPAAPTKRKDHDTIVIVPVGGHHDSDDMSGGEIAAVVVCSLLLAVVLAWVIWATRDRYRVNKSN